MCSLLMKELYKAVPYNLGAAFFLKVLPIYKEFGIMYTEYIVIE